jgi:dihydroflavonol-4-reductase
MKRALVTGATGFIGANLVRTLLARGFRVRVLVRPLAERSAIEGLDVEYARGDVLDPETLEAAMRACDVVFHTAAFVSFYVPDRAEMRRINVTGTRNVLAAARKAGVPRVVHTSSVAAIGASYEPLQIANELTPFNLGRRGFDYSITKHEAEEAVREAVAAGLDAVIVNPSSPFGVFDRMNIGRMIRGVVRGEIPVYVNGGNNYVDVEDVCLGQVLAYEKGRRGERYILGHENLTHKETFERVARIVGAQPPRFRVPYALAWAGGAAGNLAAAVTRTPPKLDFATARMSRYYFYFTHAKAEAELGYRPRSLDAAIARQYAWMKEKGLL